MSTIPPYSPPAPGHGPQDTPAAPPSTPAAQNGLSRRACGLGPRLDLTQAGAVVGLCVLIWALTGGGYFWPVWPALGLMIGALKARGA